MLTLRSVVKMSGDVVSCLLSEFHWPKSRAFRKLAIQTGPRPPLFHKGRFSTSMAGRIGDEVAKDTSSHARREALVRQAVQITARIYVSLT